MCYKEKKLGNKIKKSNRDGTRKSFVRLGDYGRLWEVQNGVTRSLPLEHWKEEWLKPREPQ